MHPYRIDNNGGGPQCAPSGMRQHALERLNVLCHADEAVEGVPRPDQRHVQLGGIVGEEAACPASVCSFWEQLMAAMMA